MNISELKKRIKIAWWILNKRKGAIILTCAHCHGVDFEEIESAQEGQTCTSKFRCKRCDSEVINTEQWSGRKLGV